MEKVIYDENNYVNPEFLIQLNNFLTSGGHKYQSVQSKVCYFVIERIYRRTKLGYGKHFGGIKIDLEENIVIEGNHRYIAYEMAGFLYDVIPSNKNHCDSSPYQEFKSFSVDVAADWDKGNSKTIKYCDDEFLKEYEID